MQISSRAQYIEQMRARTAYPTFRALMNAYLIFQYIWAALMVLGALISGVGSVIAERAAMGVGVVMGGLFMAAIIIILAKVFYEAAIMLADIADSLIDQSAQR